MKILGIDQSLRKCAFVYFNDVPVDWYVSKTGASTVKIKRKDTTYYDTLEDQIHHVCLDLRKHVQAFKPDVICFEALSYGSAGNATRNLACLFGAMNETLINGQYGGTIITFTPTTVKAYARDFLPEERKFSGCTKSGNPKKVTMDKKMMVEAVRNLYGEEYLSEYNYSSGLDDLTDATFLALKANQTLS